MEDRLTLGDNSFRLAPAAASIMWLLSTMLLWLFAFYNTPSSAPEWLRRAQAVCFGTTASGLPDTYGWILLILAPLSLLAGLVISHRSEVITGLSIIKRTSIGRVFGAGLLVVLIWETVWLCSTILGRIQSNKIDSPIVVESLPEHYPRGTTVAPNFSLTDQSGKDLTLAQFRGKTVFVTFAFAHCRTVCPVIIKNITAALTKLSDTKVEFLILTLDPWRDTVSSLPTLESEWKLPQNAHVLSGPPEQVSKILDQFNVPRTREEKTGDVVHPALVYVIDPNGTLTYTFTNPSTQWLVEAANRLGAQNLK